MRSVKRLFLETAGWLLVVGGVAALILPGPGLLMIAGGLALLSQQYEWAERRLEPVKLRALRGAAEGVETWPRIVMSTTGALSIGAVGVLWIADPAAPTWWPVSDDYWLFGGAWAGVTLLLSCAIALGLIVYSFKRFHGNIEAREELEAQIAAADEWEHKAAKDSIR